jgi:hypothetical protein
LLALDTIINVAFVFGIGILLRRHLRKTYEPAPPRPENIAAILSPLRELLASTANHDLACCLEALSRLREQLERTQVADIGRWTEYSNALVEQVEQIIQVLKQSHTAIRNANLRLGLEFFVPMPEVNPDLAGLASEKWFPQGKSENPRRTHELRKLSRFPHPHMQSIAPFDGDALPEPTKYFDVQFRDISTEGFAFDVPERLTFDRLVARLGPGPDFVLVHARVVHQTEIQYGDTAIFRVGCQILKRLARRRD